MNKKVLVIILAVVLASTLVMCNSCSGSSYEGECADLSSEDITTNDKIVAFHQAHFTRSESKESKDKNRVCIDFSNGITEYSLNDKNNELIYHSFLNCIQGFAHVTEFIELSNDKLNKLEEFNEVYLKGGGFIDQFTKKMKQGAPIDKAIEYIVQGDNLGVLITDGELYDSEKKYISSGRWGAESIKKWLKKGNRIEIVYTDFNEGENKKHMYIMCFIPKGESKFMNDFYKTLADFGAKFDTLTYSTNLSALWQRKYKDSQHPGMEFFFEEFGVTDPGFNSGEFESEQEDMEYINLTGVDFMAPESQEAFSLIYNMRDLNKKALIQKLYFDFGKVVNYTIKPENIKLVVQDVYDDFNKFKLNQMARTLLPQCSDSLDQNNKMYCECTPSIDGLEVYDIYDKNLSDTSNSYESMLVDEFKYNKSKFNIYNGNVKDVFELDVEAGKNNELNDDGLFEIVIKFSPKLTSANKYLKPDRNNLLRVDVVLENPEVKDLNKDALIWDRINNDKKDKSLYNSFRQALNDEEVVPGGVLYSYYIEFGPYETYE